MLPPAPSSILACLSFHALGLLCRLLGMGAMFSWMLESALGLGPLLSWVPDSGLAFPKKQDRGWAENGGPWAKGLRGWVGDASGAPFTPDPPPGSMAKGLGPVLLTTGYSLLRVSRPRALAYPRKAFLSLLLESTWPSLSLQCQEWVLHSSMAAVRSMWLIFN